MDIQDINNQTVNTFFSFLQVADKTKLLLYTNYSEAFDHKTALQEAICVKSPDIPDFHEIYARAKAFSFKVESILHKLLFSFARYDSNYFIET